MSPVLDVRAGFTSPFSRTEHIYYGRITDTLIVYRTVRFDATSRCFACVLAVCHSWHPADYLRCECATGSYSSLADKLRFDSCGHGMGRAVKLGPQIAIFTDCLGRGLNVAGS